MTATKTFPPPTAEQQTALDAFATGEDMVIEAGAGTEQDLDSPSPG